MRRVAPAVAVALLLLLAGCSAVTGPGPGSNAAGPPPGVGNGEVTNATALIAAHEDALAPTGFAYVATINATTSRQSRGSTRIAPVRRRQTTTVATSGAYSYHLANRVTGATVDAWGNRSTEFVRLRAAGQTRYQTAKPKSRARLTGSALLRQYLRDGFTVTSTNQSGGQTYYRLESTGSQPPARSLPANATNVEDYRVRATVDGDGRVHAMRATANYTIGGEQATLDVRYRLERTGVEQVSRPAWIGQAG